MARNPLGLAALTGAVLLIAAPAFAGEASCLWAELSQPKRDEFLAAYASGGYEAFKAVALETRDMLGFVEACGRDDISALSEEDARKVGHAMGMALVPYALERASAYTLQRRYGRPLSTLNSAWQALEPEDRVAARKAFKDHEIEDETGSDGLAAILRAVELAGGKVDERDADDPEIRALTHYFMGRAGREASEVMF